MRGRACGDVGIVWLYAIATLVLGIWMSPLLYQAGRALAEVSLVKVTNGPIEWLAGLCAKADFPAFFQASLILAAALLFIPFIDWIRGGRFAKDRKILAMIFPVKSTTMDAGHVGKNPVGVRQAVVGFSVVTAAFLLAAVLFWSLRILAAKPLPTGVMVLVLSAAFVALLNAALQETLFRGITLGVFLNAMSPRMAVGGSAVLFAAVHFLQPPPGLTVADADAAGTGFELLGKIAAQLTDPHVVMGRLGPMLALGVLLGWARWRTASLWLPLGLHGGWIVVHAILGNLLSHGHRAGWLASRDLLREGWVPLTILGILAWLLVRHLPSPPAAEPEPTH